MEDSNGDYILMKDLEELTILKIRMSNALESSDRDDHNNNSIMASFGLDRYHNLEKEYGSLLKRVKKIIKKMPEDKVRKICMIAQSNVESKRMFSCW